MNTRLDPPPVPSLTTAERSRLRHRVMARTRPVVHRPARRWIAPAVGVGAVAAVVAGTLVVTNRPSGDAGTTTAGTPSVAPTSLEVVPDAEAAAAFAQSCGSRMHLKSAQPVTVLWARRVPGERPNSTEILMIVTGSGTSGAGSCLAPGGGGTWRTDPRVPWSDKFPAPKEGLAGLTGGTSATSAPTPVSRIWTLYRARPEVARVESRLVSRAVTGPWQRGYVDDGYVYADNRVNALVTNVRQEVRAYDAQGRLLPIEPK